MSYQIHGGIVSIPGSSQIDYVQMHGGIINLYGYVGRIIQRGGIINRFGEQEQPQPPKPQVIYRDRVEYREKVVVRDSEEHKREIRHLHNVAKYWQEKAGDLKRENNELRQELYDTERTKLLREIERLQEKLKAATSREQQLKCRVREAERRADLKQAAPWDEFRPSKEACRMVYENLKAFMDCETDSNFLNLK